MGLTTPTQNDLSDVFGDGMWFFYWKTSSSLWEVRLRDFAPSQFLLIPINWAFHYRPTGRYDFGEERPEANLSKLVSICEKLRIQYRFLIPLTPTPFLPNGGIPHTVSSTVAKDINGIAYTFADGDLLNKFFTYFEPKVFKEFRNFTLSLASYIQAEKLQISIFGMVSGSFDNGEYKDYLIDRSTAFHQAFSRYLMSFKEEKKFTINSVQEEHALYEQFKNSIANLYRENCEEVLELNWEGVIKVGFVGGNQDAFFQQLTERGGETKFYANEILSLMQENVIPSIIQLPKFYWDKTLKRMLEKLVFHSTLPDVVDKNSFEDDQVLRFRPVFSIPVLTQKESIYNRFQEHELFSFLNLHYSRNYCKITPTDFSDFEDCDDLAQRIFLIEGGHLEKSSFSSLLKLFFHGANIVIDESSFSEDLKKRIESFIIENEFEVNECQFQVPIRAVTLGGSHLVLFDGASLSTDQKSCFHFWKQLFRVFTITQFEWEGDKVSHCWQKRLVGPHELAYEEIRRLSLFNPTSYRRTIQLSVPKSYALLKVVDSVKSHVESHHKKIAVKMDPESSVALDFGYYTP